MTRMESLPAVTADLAGINTADGYIILIQKVSFFDLQGCFWCAENKSMYLIRIINAFSIPFAFVSKGYALVVAYYLMMLPLKYFFIQFDVMRTHRLATKLIEGMLPASHPVNQINLPNGNNSLFNIANQVACFPVSYKFFHGAPVKSNNRCATHHGFGYA